MFVCFSVLKNMQTLFETQARELVSALLEFSVPNWMLQELIYLILVGFLIPVGIKDQNLASRPDPEAQLNMGDPG
jgi:hypothetical protein